MRNLIFVGGLILSLFAGAAAAKPLTLFSCDFEQGGSVKATRDAKVVQIVIQHPNGEKEIVENPLDEAGVSTIPAVDGSEVDLLDILQGDSQYSLAYNHRNMIDVAKLMVFTDNKPDEVKDCVLNTVQNNLADPTAIAGIFKP